MAEEKRGRGRPKKPKTQLEQLRYDEGVKDTYTKDPKRLTKAQLIALLEKEKKKLDGGYCYMCDKHKPWGDFYVSTDPMNKSGYTPICKDCAKDIARRKDANGQNHEPTKESLQLALFYLNKPYIEHVWDASIQESNNANHAIKNPENYDVYASYIKNIAMPQYYTLTWRDSIFSEKKILYEDEKTPESIIEGREDQDVYVDFVKNKNDVVRLLNYDPFEKEAIEDQPFLYSQLLGLLDASEDANDDMMRTASCISIVRGFLQQSKLDDAIAKLMMDSKGFAKNSATIKSLQDSKSKITGVIKDLAAESCISLKNNKTAKKGENTWTGKVKKIRDLNLREGEVNGFDLNTCRGMKQVMDMSNQSILQALKLDESEYSDMIAEQRILVTKYQEEAANYKEIARILLRENIDFRDLMIEKGIDLDEDSVNLDELFSQFSSINKESDLDERTG